ncbi:protein DpdD [Neobacillus sp.]|uniref:protein DpdD n=1 Tax=Neobacillus sp. TaxID=2675273 RepID=UPI00289D7FD0|nr:protein DpdD [Neobacillus sp.]
MIESLKTKFLRLLLQIDGSNPFQLSFRETEWAGPNDELLEMIKRFYNDKPFVLPFRNRKKGTFWFLFSNNESLLRKYVQELNNFLLPYHCDSLEYGKRQYFTSEKKLSEIGYELFPEGYFGYFSTIENEKIIWKNIRTWRKLDERRPSISYDELEVNAFTLRNGFHQAIVLQNWEEAKNFLNELRQGKYLNDENYKFLTIQFLSAQGKWERIWNSDDYEILSGLGRVPNQVHITLIRAFYQRILSKSDILGRYDLSIESFKEFRYRLGTLLRSQLTLDEENVIRVFAYEAANKGQVDKLMRYLEKTDDEITRNIIEFLLLYVKTNTDNPPVPIIDKLELAKQCFINREYEDAFILVIGCELSIDKVRLLSGIAIMEETEETCSIALEQFKNLPEHEQQQLVKDPQTKGWMIYLLNRREGKRVSVKDNDEIKEKLDWKSWFLAVLKDPDFDSLEEGLATMDVQQGNINWSITSLSNLSDIIAMIGIESLSPLQKTLLQTAMPMFISELLQDENFPKAKAVELYEYTREILFIHGNRNENNTGFLLRLTEGLLLLDMTKVNQYWNQIETWFNIIPTERLSTYVLETLELFKEYGLADDILQPVWTNWVGSLIDRMSKPTVIQSWIELGRFISADSSMLGELTAKIPSKIVSDPLNLLPSMSITIYSLREKPAKRAAERIAMRNINVKVRVCTDSKLTIEAKSYARNSDLIILVTACMSHALTFGIAPFIEDNLIYARSSGETGIIEALEQYSQEQYKNHETS